MRCLALSPERGAVFEFIGIFVVVYLVIMGLSRIFGGKRPKREYYIIREYEIDEEIDEELDEELEELMDRGARRRTKRPEKLPDNVVSIKHRRRGNID